MSTKIQLDVLHDILAQPLDQPAQVLRFLVEVRKVIEQMEEGRFPILEFFCDWLVHPKLDRKSAKEIIRKFDAFVGDMQTQGGTATQAQIDDIAPLISFKRLQFDVLVFLAQHKLDMELVGDSSKWEPFFSNYVDLIEGSPISSGCCETRA